MTPLLLFYYFCSLAAGLAVVTGVFALFYLALAWLLGGKR